MTSRVLALALPPEVLGAVGGHRPSVAALETLADLGAARLRAAGADAAGVADLRGVIIDAIADELLDRVRLARARERLVVLGEEVWALEEEVTGARPPTSPATLPDAVAAEGEALVPLTPRLEHALRLAGDTVDGAEPALIVLCTGYAVQAVARLADDEVRHRVTVATGAAAARRFALAGALQQEQRLALRRAGLRGMAGNLARRREPS